MATRPGFAPFHRFDRRAVLVCSVLTLAVLVIGFSYDMVVHDKWNPLKFPWYVHVHAVAYTAWLVLLAVQVALVRTGNVAQHRQLGRIAFVLLPVMLISGPLVPILLRNAEPAPDPLAYAFMGTQFTNAFGCVTLLAAGLYFRRDPATHKRLMLMGTIAVTEPGFGRVLAGPLYSLLGDGPVAYYFETYPGPLLLMLALGAYDVWTRGRPHPAWVAAFLWVLANQLLATWLFFDTSFWRDWMRVLTGH